MKVLVTGGAGFIGSHLTETLLQQPDVTLVRAIDNLSTGRRQNLAPFQSRIEFLEGDLLDDSLRERGVRGVDIVFHDAAIPSVPRSVKTPVETHRNGAHLTLLLLESTARPECSGWCSRARPPPMAILLSCPSTKR